PPSSTSAHHTPIPFSSSSSGHHRDLHSFPTRRSSDLGGLRWIRQPHRMARQGERAQGHAVGGGNWTKGHRHRGQSGRRHHVLGRDRKSTRLNSSHSQISYAVFCLKKKRN